MTNDLTDYIVSAVSENILTPIIYLLEDDYTISLICFCDRHITMQEIYDVEQLVSERSGKCTEIYDIREFSEFERLDIVNRAKLIHSEHPMMEQIFTQSLAEDFNLAMEEKKSVLDRRKVSGTCFLQ